MPAYTIKLIKKETVSHGIMAFHFEKPRDFFYLAGQYADFTLISPPQTDSEGNKRTFSLASAPFEPDLKITTRIRETAFKQVLKNLPEGSELQLEGPYGSLTLPKDSSKPAVFLTGGIGATLVRSMIAQAVHERSPHTMTFLYSNRDPEDAIFLNEFATYAQQYPNLTFVPTMTQTVDPKWSGERGLITLEMLKKYVPDITIPIYYLSGPGAMIGAMRRMLLAAGVDRNNIRADQFAGYTE